MRKIGIPLHTPVLLFKVGFKGVYITRTCFRDAILNLELQILDKD